MATNFSFRVEVWVDTPLPQGCFWTDLVNATQECADGPAPTTDVVAYILADIHPSGGWEDAVFWVDSALTPPPELPVENPTVFHDMQEWAANRDPQPPFYVSTVYSLGQTNKVEFDEGVIRTNDVVNGANQPGLTGEYRTLFGATFADETYYEEWAAVSETNLGLILGKSMMVECEVSATIVSGVPVAEHMSLGVPWGNSDFTDVTIDGSNVLLTFQRAHADHYNLPPPALAIAIGRSGVSYTFEVTKAGVAITDRPVLVAILRNIEHWYDYAPDTPLHEIPPQGTGVRFYEDYDYSSYEAHMFLRRDGQIVCVAYLDDERYPRDYVEASLTSWTSPHGILSTADMYAVTDDGEQFIGRVVCGYSTDDGGGGDW